MPRTSVDMAACVRRAATMPVNLDHYQLRTAPLERTAELLDDWPRNHVMRHVIVMNER